MNKFSLALLIISFSSQGQSIDSLLAQLPTSQYQEQLRIHQQIADAYFLNGQYAEMLEHRLKIIDLKEQNDVESGMALDWFEVGKSHYYMRNENNSNELALQFLRKAFRMAEMEKDSLAIYRVGRGIGAILGEYKKFDSAFFYLNKSKEYASLLGDNAAVSGIYCIIGTYIIEQDSNLVAANESFETALEYADNSGDPEARAYALLTLGALKRITKDYEAAESLISEAYEIQKSLGSMDGMLNTLAALANIQQHGTDIDALFKTFSTYQQLKDSVYNQNTFKAITDVQMKYETEKNEQEIKSLDLKNERNRYLILAISISAFMLLGFVYLNFKRKNYKLRAQLSEEKERIQKNRFRAVINAEESERKRIAQELHDGLGQLLSAVRLNISSLDDEEEDPKIQGSIQLIDSAVGEVRTISHNMMPSALTKVGLIAALRDMVRNINESGKVETHLNHSENLELDESTSVALYRIFQELVNNSLKYADASTINLSITDESDGIHAKVEDNGKGFDTTKVTENNGIGWYNIQSRVELLGGEVDIYSKLGSGTQVTIKLPNEQSLQTAAS